MDVKSIVDVLERDEALELDNEERTYKQSEQPVEIDWDRLFQQGPDPWEITNRDVIETINSRAGTEQVVADQEWPSDIQEAGVWDVCAWYQPIHFFAYDWGIFIREDCLIRQASRMAAFGPVASVMGLTPARYATLMIKASFAAFYFHEHFHHKVESYGIRLHVVVGGSKYLPYKRSVYRPTLYTDDCLEEALANADTYHRFSSQPYTSILGKDITKAAREYLRHTFPYDPPGYRMASKYLVKADFESAENLLHGQVKEAVLKPIQSASDWDAAPHLLRSLYNFKSNIYTVVPVGARTILPARVLPKSCSTGDLVKVYEKRGYKVVHGGKGSHVKLKNPQGQTMILPGNRRDLSIGVLNAALKALGLSILDLPSIIS